MCQKYQKYVKYMSYSGIYGGHAEIKASSGRVRFIS
jgi:hypothetical protein